MLLDIEKIESLEKLCEENEIEFCGFEYKDEDKDTTYTFYTKEDRIRFDIEFTNSKFDNIYINKYYLEGNIFNAIIKIKEYLEKNEKE